MPPQLAPALPPGCPWSGFTPPNVDWCERELCGWIVNPADAWSNLAYFAGALAMWRIASRAARGDLAHFAPASVAVGVFSFAYHASYTWLLQFFDFVGMFAFVGLAIARNAVRLGWLGAPRERAFWLAFVVAASASVPPLFHAGVPIQGTVFALILASIAQELALWRRAARQQRAGYASYWGALALLGAAAAFSLADVTRTWCEPASWLQGHALWHLLSAAALVLLLRFYAALAPARSA
jgi:hypothetical protein